MNQPNLAGLAAWIGEDLLTWIGEQRRDRGEVQRHRCLGTPEMLWLMCWPWPWTPAGPVCMRYCAWPPPG